MKVTLQASTCLYNNESNVTSKYMYHPGIVKAQASKSEPKVTQKIYRVHS